MLSNWQIVLLDNSVWMIPAASVFSLILFPWRHWNSLLEENNC